MTTKKFQQNEQILIYLEEFLEKNRESGVENFTHSKDSLILGFLSTNVALTAKHVEKCGEKFENLSDALKNNFEFIFRKNLDLREEKFLEFLKNLQEEKISSVSILDENYPQNLKNLFDPPPVLFYQGDLKLCQFYKNLLAVVGARNMVNYGENMCQKILSPLVQEGVITVSGLAYGIDKMAHEISVKNGAKTIGVIGSGLDKLAFYPKENWYLKEQILKNGGLVLSEYAPKIKPTKFSFPKRNRIIAALCETTFVVQANYKSGSLITARIANDLGKNIITIPARVNDAYFDGNLNLLKDGAIMVLDENDILNIMGLKLKNRGKNEVLKQSLEEKNNTLDFENEEQKTVYLALQKEALILDEIILKTGLDFDKVCEVLLMLEMEEKIANNDEKWEII